MTHAREGKLYMMLGGKRESFRRAEPLLKDLTVSLHYIGGPGKAAELKALVNMVMNINTAGLAEGLGLAEALGLDLKIVKDVFRRLERIHECSRLTVPTCLTASIRHFSPLRMQRRIQALRLNSRNNKVFFYRYSKRRSVSTTRW